jgi:hypothetical protein
MQITPEMITVVARAIYESFNAPLTHPGPPAPIIIDWDTELDFVKIAETALTTALSAAWSDPKDAPENTPVLCWASWLDESQQFYVDQFKWVNMSEWETVSQTSKKQTRELKEWREQEWLQGCRPEKWQPLPHPPVPIKE